MNRYLLLLACLFSLSAFAEDYNFGSSVSGGRHSSASAACTASALYVYPSPNYRGASGSVSGGGSSYSCTASAQYLPKGSDDWSNISRVISIDRRGDGCRAGTTYNDAQGSCDLPATGCAANKGKVIKSFHWLSATDSPSKTISVDGCAADISGFTICKTASPSVYSCTGTATWTGDDLKSSSGSGSECSGDDCHKGDPEDGTTSEPCIKQDNGAGYTCTSKVEDSKVGETNCGTANGVYVCTPSVTPAKTTITNDVSQIQTANEDGSLTTKNVTTTTKTTCIADKCTETKYTTVTKGGQTSEGMPTGTSSSCTGKDCPSQTSGATGSGGGGGNSQTGEAGASKDCSKPVTCKGDIYQCAILNQDFISMCSLKELPTTKDLTDLKASSDKFAAAQVTNQQELDQSANSVLNTFKTAANGGGGTTSKCLPDYNFSASGHSFDMRFSSACDTLTGIRYAILAIAYLLAIRRISMEL